MADEYEFDEEDNDEMEDLEDDDDDNDSDDDIDDEEDDEEDNEEDLDDDLDDDGEDSVELSLDTDIPVIEDADGNLEVDTETLSETEPSDISVESWEELVGRGFDFDQLMDYYGEDSLYEIEIGIDYKEAA